MERIQKILSAPALGLMMAAGLLLSSAGAHADAKRYIVSFKTPTAFQAASLKMSKSKSLADLGLADQGNQEGMYLLHTNALIEKSLSQVEMMIVDIADEATVEQLRSHPAIADVEQETFLPAPRPITTASMGSTQVLDVNPPGRRAATGEIDIPWGILAVKADKAWSTTKGEGSRVLVLDTGIDKGHPDLASRFEKGRDFTSPKVDKNASSSDDVTDTIGHGTHVSGTIAADGDHSGLIGVAPRAKILMGRVCASNGCSTAAIIAGIDWGIAERVSLISMSLGGPLSTPSQQKAVERAEAANINVVAASGNDGVRRISYPAAYPTAIAVGAVGMGNGTLKRAEFSQYGPGLDVVAPGVDVVSSVPRGAGRVTKVSVDLGDGKDTRIKSAGLQGAPQISNPVVGQMVFAGLGKPDDIAKVNLKGKFALIQRGEITFKDKVVNAMNAGASGVLIFNNAPGLARGGLGEGAVIRIPCAMIEQSTGEQMRDLVNKGTGVQGSIQTEASDYDSYDGTSMATPHVAGVVALIRSANPKLTVQQVRDVLTQTANQIGAQDEYGAGIVDAEKAVRRAQQTTKASLASGF